MKPSRKRIVNDNETLGLLDELTDLAQNNPDQFNAIVIRTKQAKECAIQNDTWQVPYLFLSVRMVLGELERRGVKLKPL